MFLLEKHKNHSGTWHLCISPSVLVWWSPTHKQEQELSGSIFRSAGGLGSNPVQKHENKDTARDPGMIIHHFSNRRCGSVYRRPWEYRKGIGLGRMGVKGGEG